MGFCPGGLLSALCREVGITPEMLLVQSEQGSRPFPHGVLGQPLALPDHA